MHGKPTGIQGTAPSEHGTTHPNRNTVKAMLGKPKSI